MRERQNRPLIFDIHRGSIDDGPGIRTVVFLKGCPLNCIWCHNPESIDYDAEMAFYSAQCIGCGACGTVCPNGAINFELVGRIERKLCISCGKCADACPTLALKKIGRYYTINELTEILKLDKEFYKVSGGGVTFSGGEPLLYMDYLSKVMNELKKEGINILIETCGFFDFSTFQQKILGYVDIVFYDIKFLDPYLHKKYTGRDNRLIINNFKCMLKEKSIQVIPRLPLIPGITAVPENLLAIADFISEAGSTDYSLLTYNTGGIAKSLSIQKTISADIPDYMPDKQEEKQWREMFEKRFKGIDRVRT